MHPSQPVLGHVEVVAWRKGVEVGLDGGLDGGPEVVAQVVGELGAVAGRGAELVEDGQLGGVQVGGFVAHPGIVTPLAQTRG